MISSLNLETLIIEQSKQIASQMVKIAKWANSEEDIRHECNKLIETFLKKTGLKVKGRHEYHIGSGRLDSKYQGILLEYKHSKGPDRIDESNPNHPGNKKVILQLKQRFIDFEREQKYRPERLFGVGCDGDTLLFVRYNKGRWNIEKPQPVTPYSVERLLRALISLGAQGYAFIPENLISHFGVDSTVAQKGIHKLYHAITSTNNPKAKTFFSQWKILFGEVCGYDVEGKNEKIKRLGDHYRIHSARPAELLFSVHSYYAIFMKLLAAEIASSFSPLGISVLKKCLAASTPYKLFHEMEYLEQGGIWSQLGITNFLEGDLFSWYLATWDTSISEVVWDIVRTLDLYDPTTLSVDPTESRDLLKKLYQHLFPKSVRHDLGEYYTPDWLAEHDLNEVGYKGNPNKRLLDPACGSGTFLVIAINRVKYWFDEHRYECGYDERELIEKILKNIIGFDLNPLAVMAARTNYLLAIRDLLKFASSVEIPVYLCDSIMTPAEYAIEYRGKKGAGADLWTGYRTLKLKTSAGEFFIPKEIASGRDILGKYSDVLEKCIRAKDYTADEFIVCCREENLPIVEERLHRELYDRLHKLDANNQNGIWSRIIKNAFAPLFVGRMDYVVGNPPWINWRTLPPEYRKSVAPLWQNYNLFTQTGLNARLGAGMDDISILMLFVSADNFLIEKGKLGFVITQTLFKSAGGGKGFRRFQLDDNHYLKVIRVCDFSKCQPFQGAANRTAVLTLQKSKKPNTYPVKYLMFEPVLKGKSATELAISDLKSFFSISEMEAYPIGAQSDSSWITLKLGMYQIIKKIQGKSPYRARIGAHSGGAAGVFWIDVIEKTNKGVLIQNLHDAGRNKFPEVTKVVESDFVRPLLRGRDVDRWRPIPSHFIIIPYDIKNSGKAVKESRLRTQYTKTFEYFNTFKDRLINRPHYKQHFAPSNQPYWSMYNVGDYTFAKNRVVWREQSAEFKCCVVPILRENVIVADAKLIVVECSSSKEAHFVAACLNSSPARLLIQSYAIEVQISTHVLSYVAIPAFDGSTMHNKLAEMSKKCHIAAAKDDTVTIRSLEAEIDKTAAKLWNITDDELKAIQNALKEKE